MVLITHLGVSPLIRFAALLLQIRHPISLLQLQPNHSFALSVNSCSTERCSDLGWLLQVRAAGLENSSPGRGIPPGDFDPSPPSPGG